MSKPVDKEKEPLIDVAQIKGIKKKTAFIEAVRDYRAQSKAESEAKAAKKAAAEKVIIMMIAAKVEKLGVDGLSITKARGRNTQISAKKLLEKGVTADVIMGATVVTEYDYIVTGKPKDDTGDYLVED